MIDWNAFGICLSFIWTVLQFLQISALKVLEMHIEWRKEERTWSALLQWWLFKKCIFVFHWSVAIFPDSTPTFWNGFHCMWRIAFKKIARNALNGELSHLISSLSIKSTKEAISFEFVAFNNGKECAALTDSLRVVCLPVAQNHKRALVAFDSLLFRNIKFSNFSTTIA